jgi:sulfite dehydrogenase (cytochrome) subunit B
MKSNYFEIKQMRRKILASLAVALCVAGFAILLRAKEFDMPPDTQSLKPGPGVDSAALCTACHSPDYIAFQPRLTRTVWKAEVTKMITKYAAPIPTNNVDQIVNYLTVTYGKEDPATNAAAK